MKTSFTGKSYVAILKGFTNGSYLWELVLVRTKTRLGQFKREIIIAHPLIKSYCGWARLSLCSWSLFFVIRWLILAWWPCSCRRQGEHANDEATTTPRCASHYSYHHCLLILRISIHPPNPLFAHILSPLSRRLIRRHVHTDTAHWHDTLKLRTHFRCLCISLTSSSHILNVVCTHPSPL